MADLDVVTLALAKKYTDSNLDGKADLVNGKVPEDELPSYVDDVTEYEDLAHFPQEGEEGKIYVALDTGYTYRWSGSTYVQIGGQDLSNYYAKNASLIPSENGTKDIGSSTFTFKDLYLGGSFVLKGTTYDAVIVNENNRIRIKYSNTDRLVIGNSDFIISNTPTPNVTNLLDLGSLSRTWKDLYLSRNLSDATNSFSVAEGMAQFNPTAVDTNAEIKWSKMLSFSKTANTTFTFETAKSGCLNEYKAIITNSGSNAIALTFTGVTNILCNDDNISVLSNVIALPAGVTIEVNVLNNKLIAVNFDAE